MCDQTFKCDLLAAVSDLRAFALSLSGKTDRADDLVQDTLMRAWAHRSSFAVGSNFRAWLFTILRNDYYSILRKRSREVEDVDGVISKNVPVNPGQHGHMDLCDLRNALDELPAEQRDALLLVSVSDMSYDEAAEVCHVAVGTIKSRVSRARSRLADMLGLEDDYTPPVQRGLRAGFGVSRMPETPAVLYSAVVSGTHHPAARC